MAGVLIVTGGSRGIGAACASLAARRGYRVCVNFRSSPARAERVVTDIRTSGGTAISVQGDSASEKTLRTCSPQRTTLLGLLPLLLTTQQSCLMSAASKTPT